MSYIRFVQSGHGTNRNIQRSSPALLVSRLVLPSLQATWRGLPRHNKPGCLESIRSLLTIVSAPFYFDGNARFTHFNFYSEPLDRFSFSKVQHSLISSMSVA